MTTRKLYKDGDFILADANSPKERQLLALGWKEQPEASIQAHPEQEQPEPDPPIPDAEKEPDTEKTAEPDADKGPEKTQEGSRARATGKGASRPRA